MAYEFKLPDLGEGLTEGEIARWLVAEGQEIAEDEPLVEIQTDKTTVEIPSPAAGTVARILVAEGEVVPVGTVLVVIGGDGAEPAAERRRPEPRSPSARRRKLVFQQHKRRVQATPLVRRIAQELGVDLASLSGTGPERTDHRGRRPRRPRARSLCCRNTSPEGRREPLRGVRRQIAEHLARAHREVPAVTFVEECDFTDVDLKRIVPLDAHGGRRVAAGVPGAERAARGRRDRLPRPLRHRGRRPDRRRARRPGRPRLRHARRSTSSPRRSRGSPRPRAPGTLKPEELRGCTFTVTSAGKLGGLFVTPLVNHPEVGDPRHPPDRRRAPSSATGRSSSARSATSRSRSTTASSTGRGRRRSRST